MPRAKNPNERKLFTTKYEDRTAVGERVFNYKAQEWFIVTRIEESIEHSETVYDVYGIPERIYEAGG